MGIRREGKEEFSIPAFYTVAPPMHDCICYIERVETVSSGQSDYEACRPIGLRTSMDLSLCYPLKLYEVTEL